MLGIHIAIQLGAADYSRAAAGPNGIVLGLVGLMIPIQASLECVLLPAANGFTVEPENAWRCCVRSAS